MKTNDKLIEQIGRVFADQVIDATRAFDDWGKTYPDAVAYRANGAVLHHIAEIDPEGSLGLAAMAALEGCWNGYVP